MTTWTKKVPSTLSFPPQPAIPTGDFFVRGWFTTGFFNGLGYVSIWEVVEEPTTSWSET